MKIKEGFICSGCGDSDKELSHCGECDVLLCENCALKSESDGEEYCDECFSDRML